MSSSTGSDEAADTRSAPNVLYKDPDDGRQRFLLELEFVQCLANPTYIHYLAQNRFFEDEAFIGYLKYLQYWHRPELPSQTINIVPFLSPRKLQNTLEISHRTPLLAS
ncbi:hypothetical protein QQ045_016286 [Rhodiola kirilowii]